MDATIEIDSGAELRYAEGHYHGRLGGVTVLPSARARIYPHARYISDFSLTSGEWANYESITLWTSTLTRSLN